MLFISANVLRMCEAGNTVAKQIVVDTYDSALFGEGLCRCDLTVNPPNTTHQLTYGKVNNLHPNVVGCGSELILMINTATSYFGCSISPNSIDISSNSLSYFTWNSERKNSKSGFCILFEMKGKYYCFI